MVDPVVLGIPTSLDLPKPTHPSTHSSSLFTVQRVLCLKASLTRLHRVPPSQKSSRACGARDPCERAVARSSGPALFPHVVESSGVPLLFPWEVVEGRLGGSVLDQALPGREQEGQIPVGEPVSCTMLLPNSQFVWLHPIIPVPCPVAETVRCRRQNPHQRLSPAAHPA